MPNVVNAKYKAWLDLGINIAITPKALRQLDKQSPKMGAKQLAQAPFRGRIPCRHTLNSVNLGIKVKAGHFHALWMFAHPPAEGVDGHPFLRPPVPTPDPEAREPAIVITKKSSS